MKKAAIIILNWNGGEDTFACLESLRALDYPDRLIVLVDNASTDGSPETVLRRFPEASLVRNAENLGYAAGNNAGIRYALEQGADYIFLLNNDTAVEPDFLSRLVEAAERDPALGIIGPKILFFGSRTLWYAGGFLDRATGLTYHRGENEPDRGQYDLPGPVDFASGCGLLARRAVFEQLGGFDPDYHHGYEDTDLCLRAKAAGFGVGYLPRAVIYHRLARASGGRRSPYYLYYRTRNHLLFTGKLGLRTWRFWPVFAWLVLKRIAGSLVHRQPKGALATLAGIYDYYSGNWGQGRGEGFRQ